MSHSVFYTGKGDRGDTVRLAGTERVPKASALIEAVGTLDEATSAIGMARALAQTPRLGEIVPAIQRDIYRLLSHLSATPEARSQYSGLAQEQIDWLEQQIAALEVDLPPLRDFVLPGESPAGAAFHVARTVVRRAERRLVALAELEPTLGEANLAYLNRLSSLLFVAALQEDMAAGRGPRLAREETGGS